MTSGRVLIISHDVVDARMAGPGIRYRELARVLARHFPVTLAAPGAGHLPFDVWSYQRDRWDSLAAIANRADVIVACGDTLADFPELAELGTPLVMDGYDPHTLEALALWSGEAFQVQAERHRARLGIVRRQCQAGDFFICASERQRDWWLGFLEQQGRINPHTYAHDPSLRRLIDVVPYGLRAEPPQPGQPALRGEWPGLGPDDPIVLWGGGLWEWLDPLTALRAVRRLADGEQPSIRLVFPGTRHPSPDVPDMPMRKRAMALADELELTDRHAFFGDWVPHRDWPSVLLESNVGLSLHSDTVEARLAYRSRVLDYVWAGLPMVVTRGDAISQVVQSHELGAVVDYEDDVAVAHAIMTLLERPRSAWRDQFSRAQAKMTWESAAEPLIEFCRGPHRAADRLPSTQGPRGESGHETSQPILDLEELCQQVGSLSWYHTIDLGNGIVTPGAYDHRQYLHHYGIPEDLSGKTALDVGAASGFFSFEMERRGARVTAIDLPAWLDHDFGPNYTPDLAPQEGPNTLREPILLAKRALGSRIDKLEMTVYDISPETVGLYDLVFCGSLLLHLTDPITALCRLQSVTREQAIIATAIHPDASVEARPADGVGSTSQAVDGPLALFDGHHRGDVWWMPNRPCFEAWISSAGFAGWEWVSEFRLDYRDGRPGPYHGVIRAWNEPQEHRLPVAKEPSRSGVGAQAPSDGVNQALAARDAEIARLQELVAGYEQGRFMRLMRQLDLWRTKVGL